MNALMMCIVNLSVIYDLIFTYNIIHGNEYTSDINKCFIFKSNFKIFAYMISVVKLMLI